MMDLIAEHLRLRWRLSWPGSLAVSGPRRKVGQADPAKRIRPRQNTGVEKSADVLEEIWRAADRKRPKANFTLGSGLVRELRVALAGMKADVFGVLSVLQSFARTEPSDGSTLDSFVHSMPGSRRPRRCGGSQNSFTRLMRIAPKLA